MEIMPGIPVNTMNKITIEIQEKPPSVNHVWKHIVKGRFARVYLTKEGREFKERLSNKIPLDIKPFEGPVKVEIELTFPNNLRRDIDNYSKCILDALNKKVFIDDSQITELIIKKNVEKNKPNIKIIVECPNVSEFGE